MKLDPTFEAAAAEQIACLRPDFREPDYAAPAIEAGSGGTSLGRCRRLPRSLRREGRARPRCLGHPRQPIAGRYDHSEGLPLTPQQRQALARAQRMVEEGRGDSRGDNAATLLAVGRLWATGGPLAEREAWVDPVFAPPSRERKN